MTRGRHTELTEASVVIGALHPPLLGMRVETLVAGRTVVVLGLPPAPVHAAEVLLVHELTCVALLT